jgi:CelD/BcsL family acetyltransferase involved in cellulose biosynthesis
VSLTTSIHALEDAGIDERWTALWRRSPQRTPFARAAFLRAAAAVGDGLTVRVHLVDDRGQDVAGCALHERRRGPYREVVLPAFTPYSGFLLLGRQKESDVHYRRSPFERLLEGVEARYHSVRIHVPPGVDDVRPAVWRGWTAQPFYTYGRELKAASDPTEGWSTKTAGAFRKHSENYEVVEPDISACIPLFSDSYGRSGRRMPLTPNRLQRLIERLKEGGVAEVYGARNVYSNELEAAVIVPRDDVAAYYWIAGSVPGPAMTVLIGKLLQILAADGVERFDFVGANTPTIAEFKRKFGCTLRPYHGITLFTRMELRVLDAVMQILH